MDCTTFYLASTYNKNILGKADIQVALNALKDNMITKNVVHISSDLIGTPSDYFRFSNITIPAIVSGVYPVREKILASLTHVAEITKTKVFHCEPAASRIIYKNIFVDHDYFCNLVEHQKGISH